MDLPDRTFLAPNYKGLLIASSTKFALEFADAFAKEKSLYDEVNNMAEAAEALLPLIDFKVLAKSLNASVIIAGIIHHESAKSAPNAESVDNIFDAGGNILAGRRAMDLRHTQQSMLEVS